MLLVGVTAGLDRVVARVTADDTVPMTLRNAISTAHGTLVLVVVVILSILAVICFAELLSWLYRGR